MFDLLRPRLVLNGIDRKFQYIYASKGDEAVFWERRRLALQSTQGL